MLDTPIIVSDEEIKKDNLFYSLPRKSSHKCTAIFENNLIDNSWEGRERVEIIKSDCYKIIAGLDGLPSIDWNGLEEEFGWFDVKKLSKEDIKFHHKNIQKREIDYILGYEDGFNKAQSLNEKKFSLEDMMNFGKKCFYEGFYKSENDDADSFTAWRESIYHLMQPLQQPKVFDIEVETEEVRPKIVHNSIKIIKKL